MPHRTKRVETFAKDFGLSLSTRTMNILAVSGIDGIDSFVATSLFEFRRMFGAGQKTIDEIVAARAILTELGFSALEPPLSLRAERTLIGLDVESFGNLAFLSLKDVVSVKGIGRGSLAEIAEIKHRQQIFPRHLPYSKIEKKYLFHLATQSLPIQAWSILERLGISDLDSYIALDLRKILTKRVSQVGVYDEIALPLERLRGFLLTQEDISADDLEAFLLNEDYENEIR